MVGCAATAMLAPAPLKRTASASGSMKTSAKSKPSAPIGAKRFKAADEVPWTGEPSHGLLVPKWTYIEGPYNGHYRHV